MSYYDDFFYSNRRAPKLEISYDTVHRRLDFPSIDRGKTANQLLANHLVSSELAARQTFIADENGNLRMAEREDDPARFLTVRELQDALRTLHDRYPIAIDGPYGPTTMSQRDIVDGRLAGITGAYSANRISEPQDKTITVLGDKYFQEAAHRYGLQVVDMEGNPVGHVKTMGTSLDSVNDHVVITIALHMSKKDYDALQGKKELTKPVKIPEQKSSLKRRPLP